MNYRHAYHAGNFADVLKHAVLALILQYMTTKPAPLRVIDVHAGIGAYDLEGVEASKTAEWQGGIGRIYRADVPPEIAALLSPYLNAVEALNGPGPLRSYPGSPLLARSLMRRTDTLIANELHKEDFSLLKSALKGAPNTRTLNLDAWIALKSLVPPQERRGLIVIDPPFEEADEFARLVEGLSQAIRRFESGTYLVWYPIKEIREVSRFILDVKGLGLKKVIGVSLAVRARGSVPGLTETGLVIVNPPYILARQLAQLMPVLSQQLAAGPGAGFELSDWSL
ncbi:MAG: 23S rRNA (adenine(2030)-N(6))-methyltransferase RlmJ [Hyphomicrobiaceae bacterium]|nr:23S rRNA (adenine(2030)-N(6))-methyltransferase RlmJ [Hyphomicrobiaceae bacterium]